MSEITFDLKGGLKGTDQKGAEIHHRKVVLKDLTAGEILDANRAAERIISTPEGPVLAVSPTEAMRQVLMRHVKKIGELDGPLSEQMLNALSREDLDLLNTHASKYTKLASREVEHAGRGGSKS